MAFISMHFHICILPKFVLEIAFCLLMKTKQSTDHLRLSSKQQVILNSQLLCFVPFMVFGWHSRRIYSLCWKTVIVAKSMVIFCIVLSIGIYESSLTEFICTNSYLQPQRSGYTSYSCIKHVYMRTRTSMTCLIRY